MYLWNADGKTNYLWMARKQRCILKSMLSGAVRRQTLPLCITRLFLGAVTLFLISNEESNLFYDRHILKLLSWKLLVSEMKRIFKFLIVLAPWGNLISFSCFLCFLKAFSFLKRKRILIFEMVLFLFHNLSPFSGNICAIIEMSVYCQADDWPNSNFSMMWPRSSTVHKLQNSKKTYF